MAHPHSYLVLHLLNYAGHNADSSLYRQFSIDIVYGADSASFSTISIGLLVIKLPHVWLIALLAGLVFGSMGASAVATRWGDPLATLFGEFGVVTVMTGVVTVFFLGYRAVVGHLALVNTQRSLEHTQRAEVATRFQKGMEMLANGHQATRIGGLYLLRDVVIALPGVYWSSVADSLLPFIKTGCEPQSEMMGRFLAMLEADEEPDESFAWLDTTPPDVLVALRILGRGWPELREATAGWGLEDRHLRGLVVANVQLRDLDFNGAIFDGAVFQGAKFLNCSFDGCALNVRSTKSRFVDCELVGAEIFSNFMPFSTSDMNFTRCDLREAEIDGHRISQISFEASDTTGATLLHRDIKYFPGETRIIEP